MAGYSARQATYTSGDTITAAHSNDEFNQLLAAFNASTGHTHDGTAGDGGPITTLRDSDALNKILVDTSNNHLEFYVEVSSAAVQQLRIQDGAIVPITDSDIDLGTSSLEFKDLFIDGTANIDALVADTADINGGTVDGATLGTNSAITQAVIDNININGATIGHTSDTDLLTLADGVLTVAGEVSMTTLDIGGTNVTSTAAELNILDGVTSTASELNLVDGITAGTVSASKAVIVDSNKDISGFRNLTISGDLTVSGDDITMGTNTAGNILVADGTNFNSVAVGGLSEISTVANDDVLLAVDTSGGGLKKITRSTLTAGIVSGSEISNVVEDTTPQLGGNLDMNGQDIVTTSNADIELAPNGTGHVTIKGNTNQGTLQLNCENNSHGQQIVAAPHSESANNVLTLPSTGGDSTLVSDASTSTLTNKTLTTPVIAEIDSSADITLDATNDVNIPANVGLTFGDDGEKIEGDGTRLFINSSNAIRMDAVSEIRLDSDSGAIEFYDGGTQFGEVTNSSTDLILRSIVSDKDLIFKGNDGGSEITALTLDMSNAGAAVFSAAAYNAEATLTDASTISWNAITQPVAKVTLGANRTLGAASGGVAGAFISLLIIQDGTGSRTVSFNAAYEFAADTAPTLTTTASKGDLFVFRYNGSKWLEVGRNLNLTLS